MNMGIFFFIFMSLSCFSPLMLCGMEVDASRSRVTLLPDDVTRIQAVEDAFREAFASGAEADITRTVDLLIDVLLDDVDIRPTIRSFVKRLQELEDFGADFVYDDDLMRLQNLRDKVFFDALCRLALANEQVGCELLCSSGVSVLKVCRALDAMREDQLVDQAQVVTIKEVLGKALEEAFLDALVIQDDVTIVQGMMADLTDDNIVHVRAIAQKTCKGNKHLLGFLNDALEGRRLAREALDTP